MMTLDLPLLFAFALAFSIAMYVVMDGFDLGIGILFPFAPAEVDRDAMMNSVAPIWDGNETWLVMGGALMIAAFPLAYATLLPAFYVPLAIMLFALIFRGIAFEFRFRAGHFRYLWNWAFTGGSTMAAFCQGLILGAFIEGVPVRNEVFAGGATGVFTPFAVMSGFGLIAGYALLSATWLIMKTSGTTRDFGRRSTRPALLAALGFIAVVSLWTPITQAEVAQRWFSLPNILFLWPVPFVTALVAWVIWRSVAGTHDYVPFLFSILLFLLAFAGLGVSLFPYAVPWSVTIWRAAASPATLEFTGVGVLIILPITLAYLGLSHWVFRGRAHGGEGYGEHDN